MIEYEDTIRNIIIGHLDNKLLELGLETKTDIVLDIIDENRCTCIFNTKLNGQLIANVRFSLETSKYAIENGKPINNIKCVKVYIINIDTLDKNKVEIDDVIKISISEQELIDSYIETSVRTIDGFIVD